MHPVGRGEITCVGVLRLTLKLSGMHRNDLLNCVHAQPAVIKTMSVSQSENDPCNGRQV